MADVSQEQGGAAPRRPILRPFSGTPRGAGQGPLKPLGARRLAVSPHAHSPDESPLDVATTSATSAVEADAPSPVAQGMEAEEAVRSVALAEPVDESSAPPEVTVSDMIEDSEPVRSSDVVKSALDVSIFAERDSPSRAWEVDDVAFGSAYGVETTPAAEDEEAPTEALLAQAPFGLAQANSHETADAPLLFEDAEATGMHLADDDPKILDVNDCAPLRDEDQTMVTSSARVEDSSAPDFGSFVVDDAAYATVDDSAGLSDVESVASAVEGAVLDDRLDWGEAVATPLGSIEVEPSVLAEWGGESESVRVEEPAAATVARDSEGAIAADASLEPEDMRAQLVEAVVETGVVVSAEVPAEALIEASLRDAEPCRFHLTAEEVVEVPAPILGLEALIRDTTDAGVEPDPTGVAAATIGNGEGTPAVAVVAEECVEAPREDRGDSGAATAPAVWCAPGDAGAPAHADHSESQAHVLAALEAVARRVRRGEIVSSTDVGASPEAVLASVLSSLLSARP